MQEEIKNTAPEEQKSYVEDLLNANDTLKREIENLQGNMNKMEADNKALLSKVLNGGNVETKQEDKTTVEEYREMLYGAKSDQLNDLQYIENTLKLRKKLIDKGEMDPFVGFGHNYTPSEDEFEKAEEVAQIYQECVDYANGDNQLFIQELQRRTQDISLGNRNIKRR